MTIPYNATSTSLVNYILNSLVYSHGGEYITTDNHGEKTKKYLGWYKADNSSENCKLVNYKDVNLNYFKEMATILNNLNLPIIWRLPTGLVVKQKYMKQYIKRIVPFKNRNSTISLALIDNLKIDFKKQKTALMPNLIHYLDSTVLFLLFNVFSSSIEGTGGVAIFYSVHDCYGVSAKYVAKLISLLKTIYIDLYSNISYIKQFDNDKIELIKLTYGEKYFIYDQDNRVIHLEDKIIKLPNISNILLCKNKPLWYESLLGSQYLAK